jgi:hypothetical protein
MSLTIEVNQPKQKTFEDLQPNECFMWRDRLFVKLEFEVYSKLNNLRSNAYCFSDNDHYLMNESDPIVPMKLKLVEE